MIMNCALEVLIDTCVHCVTIVFIKLASQLTVAKLVELAVIPVIFTVMTLTSYLCSLLMAKLFRLGRRRTNFVIAMGVFGNSNSLPISLVTSLSVTLASLHWTDIPEDNSEAVGARGILYLLIFQQLGQVVRWSWGYHVLLGPREEDTSSDSPTVPTEHPPTEKPSPSLEAPISRPRRVWQCISKAAVKVYISTMAFMNPPLWAMLVAIIVASIPPLKSLFFTRGTFFHGSVTYAVHQMGGIAVPLILVVLGASLGSNGTTTESLPPSVCVARQNNKLLIASLLSRMVLPFLIMAPLLAVAAKYLPISILGDPIFVVVCYLLVGAPSALQLAQICQINGVYEAVMARLMFWSYVVVILPSTVVLVVTAVQVVGWAAN